MAQAIVLPGKAERALRYEFVCKIGGPPEFRYCNGEWSKQVENVSAACCPLSGLRPVEMQPASCCWHTFELWASESMLPAAADECLCRAF